MRFTGFATPLVALAALAARATAAATPASTAVPEPKPEIYFVNPTVGATTDIVWSFTRTGFTRDVWISLGPADYPFNIYQRWPAVDASLGRLENVTIMDTLSPGSGYALRAFEYDSPVFDYVRGSALVTLLPPV